MTTYYTVLTALGQPKVAASLLPGGAPLAITSLAFGDGGGAAVTPTENRASLINEVHRRPVTSVTRDPNNANWVVVETVIPAEVGGWPIREVGLIDADGDLVGYGNFPDTYKPVLLEGSGKELVVRIYLEITSAAQVTLQIDPSVVMASRSWVEGLFAQHHKDHRAQRHYFSQI